MRVVILLSVLSLALGARLADRVLTVPGLEPPEPTFKHYAGFLQASGTRKFFYWFVESEQNPQQDPVVLWLNGGPGCSSLTGFFVEQGPWRINQDGTGLYWFEERWNKIANIIFLESPAGVGYSHSNDTTYATDDDEVAYDNHLALIDFFTGFPEYQNNEFYVTGESYAGTYVPTLSARLEDDARFNFKGMAVGNGVSDDTIMGNSLVYFMWARGLIGTDLWLDITENCCEGDWTDCDFVNNKTVPCATLMTRVNNIAWNSGINPYQIYDSCWGGAITREGRYSEVDNKIHMTMPGSLPLITQEARDEYQELFRQMSRDHDVYGSIPCTDTSNRDTYLNDPAVREAIHVPDYVQPWEACSTPVGALYRKLYSTVTAEYLKVLNKGHRVLVYNGDLDMACNHLGDLWFVESLKQNITEDFKKWLYTDDDGFEQVAGGVSQYVNMNYVSVRGAGHFVPTDKPLPAFIMWKRFLLGDTYP